MFVTNTKVGKMKVLNYHAFYETFATGVVDKRMTPVSRLLFRPLFEPAELVDENGTPYEIESWNGSKWAGGKKQIPKTIKNAITDEIYKEDIILHFNKNVLSVLKDKLMKDEMLDAMIELVKGSSITDRRKTTLVDLYEKDKIGDFLAYTFMTSLLENNLIRDVDPDEIDKGTDKAIEDFNLIVKSKYKKPKPIPVPDVVASDEIPYVKALYDAYTVTTGTQVDCPEDLNTINYRRHFERQRKNYYLAETIHREIRDTIRQGEDDDFEVLKDEVEEGVIETCEDEYETPVKRIDAVMKEAGHLSISHNADQITLGWIGAGEKKGICHMLVNEARLNWVEVEKDEKGFV